MALTPEIRTSQSQVLSVSEATPDLRVSEAQVFSIINFPTEELRISQVQITSVLKPSLSIRLSQVQVFAVVRGRIENRRIRAWTFSLDGHDFYVLRLGETETLVLDVTTGQWSSWDGGDTSFWRPQVGMNWIGMDKTSFDNGANSEAVCGDDTYGILWVLNPDQGYDEHPTEGEDDVAYTRQVVGGLPMRMRDTQPVGAVYLTASVGEPQLTGATITLRTSDDSGRNWTTHGTITSTAGDYDQEFVWRSLGRIKAPGRLFEISDNGASVRLDGLDMK